MLKKTFYSRALESHQQLLLQVVPFQQPQEVETESFFDDSSGDKSPCELVGDVDPQEFEGVNFFHTGPIDQEWEGLRLLLLPEMDDQLLGFCGVQFQVVLLTPRCQSLNLLPVLLFITLCNETSDSCVVCKFNDGVGQVSWSAIIEAVK